MVTMITALIASAIGIVLLMMYIPQTPAMRKRAMQLLEPLNELLSQASTTDFVWSFDCNLQITANYQQREVIAEVHFGQRGLQGEILIKMLGLRPYPRLPILISEYPKIYKNIEQHGQCVVVTLDIKNYMASDFSTVLDDLAEASSRLENK